MQAEISRRFVVTELYLRTSEIDSALHRLDQFVLADNTSDRCQ